jgi:hypothetical protein
MVIAFESAFLDRGDYAIVMPREPLKTPAKTVIQRYKVACGADFRLRDREEEAAREFLFHNQVRRPSCTSAFASEFNLFCLLPRGCTDSSAA